MPDGDLQESGEALLRPELPSALEAVLKDVPYPHGTIHDDVDAASLAYNFNLFSPYAHQGLGRTIRKKD